MSTLKLQLQCFANLLPARIHGKKKTMPGAAELAKGKDIVVEPQWVMVLGQSGL